MKIAAFSFQRESILRIVPYMNQKHVALINYIMTAIQ